ncbi:rhodanese-like domain-containing protein [Algoriphagus taiwanensis]|uniref:Rhodanese domain-containing protein n=1 Tax=Algoriphagus taiwanensis TaxID=1445656 RepID=A0ABQ6PZ61_9BACT|nr:hypothetical protein Ataiwa_11680 [Algoriphagus taiwanensis]
MESVIIDVRTRKEFSEISIPGAINLPSTSFRVEDFVPFKEKQICLVCESGNRANEVYQKLKLNDFEFVSILEKQMGVHKENSDYQPSWSIDRQFRLILALFLTLFLLGAYLGWVFVWAIPVIICSGLAFSTITDNCYLKILIANFPWNRRLE